MKANIIKTIGKRAGKVMFKVKKHAPEILVFGGIVGTIGGTVMACVASTKVNDVIEGHKTEIEDIKEEKERAANEIIEDENGEIIEYTNKEYYKDLAIVYIQTGYEFVKLYGPAVLVGAASIGSILKGHNILKNRYVGALAAAATIDQTFRDYRGRVVERFGEETDEELRYGIETKQIEQTVVNEKGKSKTVKKTVKVIQGNISEISDYARVFKKGNPHWENNKDYNLMFLKAQQRYAKDRLVARGGEPVYLNEIYDDCGFERSKAGQVVGWKYSEECLENDNYIDFRIREVYLENVNPETGEIEYEEAFLIDPNVDGIVWEELEDVPATDTIYLK